MDSSQIRQIFLDFFELKKHAIVPSAPLVMKDDPTLLFTNAGMNQFKDYILGNRKPDHRRIADTQKCLRVSGKHNDLEDVGLDTYHHTMFEMLGNWSFGDYFKKEAITWAWELLTEGYKLPSEDLFVTIFEGDEKDGLHVDAEALEIWKNFVPEDRIIQASKKDNFWEMGDTGPCGPCSEIHIDLRSEEEKQKISGRELVNKDHPQVIEIWNLVFMQYNRKADGSLEMLPEKHIDTGMGFERLCMAIQGKTSNYDTDVFMPLIGRISELSGKQYTGSSEKSDIAMRVIADHIRAVSFAVADGQLPSNNKAGYVIRRILRRAVRYGYSFLQLEEPFFHKLVPVLAEQFKKVFPELKKQEKFVGEVLLEEEKSFLKTLDIGIRRIQEVINTNSSGTIDGKVAFELYDTYGFPLDLTALIARENGFVVDEEGFRQAMDIQKERSKVAAASETSDWVLLDEGETQFTGYDTLQEQDCKMLRYSSVKTKEKILYRIVLNKTPFYPEGGGQVGDRGVFRSGSEVINVVDTKKENNLILHITEKLPSDPSGLLDAEVNESLRSATRKNHSATHLLHAALRKVLGLHVTQKGSYVSDKLLRFDFSHFAKLTREELQAVEQMVNEKIRCNIPLSEKRNIPVQEALSEGAMALFGEKYGDFVRTIAFDPSFSIELCGGTHATATGEIGFFKIISEGSVAAGVRRIEAVTGSGAERYVEEQLNVLEEISEILKGPKDVLKSIETLVEEKNVLLKKLENFAQQTVNELENKLASRAKSIGGLNMIVEKEEFPSSDALKQVAFGLRNRIDNLFAVLVSEIEEKPQIAVIISDILVQEYRLHAGNIVRELAKEIDGGGGGQPFFAVAGGRNTSGLPKVLEKAKEIVSEYQQSV